MEKQIIIAVGREYGSCGHIIAEKLAESMNLPFYNRNILEELAKQHNTNIEELEKFDEKPRNPLFSKRRGEFSSSMEENLAQMQFDYLRKKAEKGESFVVVGRCADMVLKDYKGLITVFITADKEEKLQHIMEAFELSQTEAEIKRVRHDKQRKAYHNEFSDFKWGQAESYDICMNVSRLGLDRTAEVLEDYIKARIAAI